MVLPQEALGSVDMVRLTMMSTGPALGNDGQRSENGIFIHDDGTSTEFDLRRGSIDLRDAFVLCWCRSVTLSGQMFDAQGDLLGSAPATSPLHIDTAAPSRATVQFNCALPQCQVQVTGDLKVQPNPNGSSIALRGPDLERPDPLGNRPWHRLRLGADAPGLRGVGESGDVHPARAANYAVYVRGLDGMGKITSGSIRWSPARSATTTRSDWTCNRMRYDLPDDDVLRELREIEKASLLSPIRCPALLIYGDGDDEERQLLGGARRALPLLPAGSRLEVIPGAPHGFGDAYDKVIQAATDWLALRL